MDSSKSAYVAVLQNDKECPNERTRSHERGKLGAKREIVSWFT